MEQVGEIKMRLTKILLTAAIGLTLAACSDKDTALQDSLAGNTVDVISNLDFGNNVIPFPNNILFSGSLDGTLNIPVADAADFSDPQVALNALDGFSTVAPITTGFTGAIDDSSFSAAVKIYEVTTHPTLGVVLSVDRMMAYGTEFVAALSTLDTTNSSMAILPLQPLKPKQSYMVVITNDLKSVSGNSVGISGSYSLTHGLDPLETGGVSNTPLLSDAQAVQLEPLRQGTVLAETALNNKDGTLSSDIILSWNFTTQSTGDVLTDVQGTAGAGGITSGASAIDLDGAGPLPAGMAGANSLVFEGTMDVPYYLTASASVNDPTALGSMWQSAVAVGGENNLTKLNTTPANNGPVTIPMLITLPVGAGLDGGSIPVVIFQHGITSDRTALLGIADKLAENGFAAIAIDMPMHGVNALSPFYSAGNERTFDLDLVTQDATTGDITAAVPDGNTDSSGRHYINLTNLLNTRDNVRQSIADLFAVRAAISTIDVNGAGGADLDTSNVYFLGHSLGAMVGTAFVAIEGGASVKDSVFAFGGTSLAKILDGSASFGPSIAAGLAANGVNKGTADYETFLGAAQTVVDSGDPVNYAATAATGRGVLFFEIVGGDSSPSDLVVPNAVPDANDTTGTIPAPLAGTDPQLALMGLTTVNTTQTGTDLLLVTKFTSGDHASILSAASDAAVTAEMQSQAASFLLSQGNDLTVTDGTVLQTP